MGHFGAVLSERAPHLVEPHTTSVRLSRKQFAVYGTGISIVANLFRHVNAVVAGMTARRWH